MVGVSMRVRKQIFRGRGAEAPRHSVCRRTASAPGLGPIVYVLSSVPHPFAFFLAKGWETSNLKIRNHAVRDLIEIGFVFLGEMRISAGRSSMEKIALCAQRDTQLPQSMHSSGLMNNWERPPAFDRRLQRA